MSRNDSKEQIDLLNRKLDAIMELLKKNEIEIIKVGEKFNVYDDKLTYTKNKLDRHCEEDAETKKDLVNKYERLERDLLEKCSKQEREYYDKFSKLDRENSEQHEKIRAELIRITAYAGGAIALALLALQYFKII